MPKINLAVIFGGRSGEHEVSLRSAQQVIDALDAERYNIIPVAITKKGHWLIGAKGGEYLKLNLPSASEQGGVPHEQPSHLVTIADSDRNLTNYIEGDAGVRIDIVMPIGHGPYIEDGRLQGMLDMLDVPYLFSGVLASAIGMNKHKAKLVAKSAGLKTAKELVLVRGKKFDPAKIAAKLKLPCVIKPSSLGSSVGCAIANTEDELKNGIERAFKYGDEVLVEEYLKGRELTVAVFGRKKPKPLPVIEIIPKTSHWFDYAAKYSEGGSDEICPAQIDPAIAKKAQRQALKAFTAIGCQDLARADFILRESDNKLYFLEINTIPGMTATSLAPKAAKAAGMEFKDFLDKLIAGALK